MNVNFAPCSSDSLLQCNCTLPTCPQYEQGYIEGLIRGLHKVELSSDRVVVSSFLSVLEL